jgi:proteasome lid subunit RPN8/RPN11
MSPPLLEIPAALFDALMQDLAAAGHGARESGAFLFGHLEPQRRVVEYRMYCEIAPESARREGYVTLTGPEMARAWDHARNTRLQVIADVHTHPEGPGQSPSDQAHPIVAVPGHVALIVPWFALRRPQPADLGVHVFLGGGRWESCFGDEARQAVHLI